MRQQRFDSEGEAYPVAENPFLDATVSVASKYGERAAMSASYIYVPASA